MTLYTGGESWLGTPGYAAPEQLTASEIQLDERVDVYALGAILYHLLTGVNPGDASEMATRSDELPPPSEIALQEIDPALDTIILHALSSNREKRYASVRTLMADLRRYLNGDALSVKATKHRSFKWLLAAAVTLLALTAGWMIYSVSDHAAEGHQDSGLLARDYHNFTFESSVSSRSTRTQFFVGGKLPNEPGVRVIPFDSAEDQDLADQLEKTDWPDLSKEEDSLRLSVLKNLLVVILSFQEHREFREWEKIHR